MKAQTNGFIPCRACPLRKLATFRDADPAEVDFIQSFKHAHRAAPAGATIVLEGRPSRELFTLFSGFAFRYCMLSDGRRQILNFLLPGDFIGLQERLDGQSAYGVETLTPVELCAFPSGGLWTLYASHARLGFDITWLAAHEERIVDGNLLTVGRRSARERVAMLLMHWHKRVATLGMVDAAGGVPFPLTQQHIADALGLSLVHTNKTLRALQRLELCAFDNARLLLPQPHALREVADYYEAELAPRPLV